MAKETLLVIEDDPDIRDLVRYSLEREGFGVYAASSGEIGFREALRRKPALVIIDLMLPGVHGLEVCRLLRGNPETKSIPIIIVSARSEETDVVVGLEIGADDYLAKPFSVKELGARVRAVLRRVSPQVFLSDRVIRAGPLTIDGARHEVKVHGREVSLTLAEFRLLSVLALHCGQVLTRDQLIEQITEGKSFIIDRNVDVHIRSIRKKLGDHGNLVGTVRGVGYRLEVSELPEEENEPS